MGAHPCPLRLPFSRPINNVGFLYTRIVGFLQARNMLKQKKTLRARIEKRIARKRSDAVFLPREFRDLGGEDQVLRVLRALVREKRLVRLGYGVYGRAEYSRRRSTASL